MRRQRHHSKQRMACVNALFIVGAFLFLSGVSALTFALGWYRLGPQMEDPKLWMRTVCTVDASRLDYSSNPYTSAQRWRALFEVAFVVSGNASFDGAVATVTLDTSWVSQAEAQKQLALYPVRNSTSCFCPLEQTNLYAHPERWSIYRFCVLQFTQAELDKLVFYYQLWLYLGIAACVATLPLVLGTVYFWIGTRCYRRPFHWWPRICFRKSGYEIVN